MRRRELRSRARAGPAAPSAVDALAASSVRTDAALMREVQRGDCVAFGELYDRFAPSVLSLASRMLRSGREAEDVVHDVFLECWRDAAEYDPLRASVRTWFLVRARSRALDNMRRARRSVMLPSDSALFEGMAAGTDDSSAEHEHATLDRLLRQLSSDQRAVVELVYFAGYSCGEIARTLGIPIGTVKSRTLRALERLRRLLESRECTQGSLP